MSTGKSGKAARTNVIATAIATLLAAAHPAFADEYHSFHIAAADASSAVREFASQSGVQIMASADALRDKKLNPVAGEHTTENALSILLADTGLEHQYIGERGVVIAPGKATKVEARPGFFWRRLRVAQADTASESQTEAGTTEMVAGESVRRGHTLEEIVVTAEKRAESIQSLPIAISALSQDDLVNRGIGDLESLRVAAPSLHVGYRFGGFQKITIRGISSEIGDLTAAVSQDGVTFASPYLLNLDLFDAARVEVLRGPQGTLGGRNATAGAINVISNQPTDDLVGGIKVTAGNLNRLASEGYVSGPIVDDRLLGRVAVRADRADGWITNTVRDQKLGSVDKVQARASFLARATDDLDVTFILDGMKDRSTQAFVDNGRIRADTPSLAEFYGHPAFDADKRTLAQDEETRTETERYQTTLKFDWDLSPSANLVATTGYVTADFVLYNDFNDASGEPLFVWDRSNPPLQDVWQLSQEMTLTADVTDRLDVILGGLYLRSEGNNTFGLGLPALGVPCCVIRVDSTSKLNSWAGYTQLRYALTDTIRVTGGIRYTHDEKESIDNIANANQSDTWSAWTPRFSLDYAPTDALTIYATLSRGFRSGGINAGTQSNYAPEYVWNRELGLKTSLLDKRLSAAFAVFDMDYTDLQYGVFLSDTSGGTTLEYTNAPSAKIRGVEAEFDVQVTDKFKLTASVTYLDATYDELLTHDRVFPELGEPDEFGLTLRNLQGNQLPSAPEWQYNATAEYVAPIGGGLDGVLRATYAWQSRIFFDSYNNPLLSQGAYDLLNVSAGIETTDGKWQLTAFANNVTNEIYRTGEAALVGTAPIPYSVGTIGMQRTYGVTIGRRF